jgi:branched-chain amino acid transport system substrate-binding protein
MIRFACWFGFALVMLANLPAARAEVVIAVPAPLAGVRSAMGLSVHVAAGIAVADINAQGGIGGRPVRLDLHDDPCTSGSLALVQAIAAGAASVVIGHPCALSVPIAAPLYRAAGKLFIAAGPSYPRRAGSFEMRLPSVQAQADALARVLVSETTAGLSRVAIVRDKTKLNIALAGPVEGALRAAGVSVVTEAFTGGDKDFAALSQRLAAGGVTHVALMAFTIEGALVAADLVKAIADVKIIGPDQLGTHDFGALAGAAAAERVRILLPASETLYVTRYSGARALAQRMAASGVVATREALETAAAIQAWAQAASSAGDLSLAPVAEQLKTARVTLLGPLSFDAKGDASLPYWTLHHWRDGGFQPLP